MASHDFIHFKKCISAERARNSEVSLSLYQAIHQLLTLNARVSPETFSFTLMRLAVESSVVYTCYLSNFAGAKWVSRREQHFIFH